MKLQHYVSHSGGGRLTPLEPSTPESAYITADLQDEDYQCETESDCSICNRLIQLHTVFHRGL